MFDALSTEHSAISFPYGHKFICMPSSLKVQRMSSDWEHVDVIYFADDTPNC